MPDVTKLIAQALLGLPPEHVGRPAAAADEQFASINTEETVSLVGKFRGDLTNAEAKVGFVLHIASNFKLKMSGIQIRLTHLVGSTEPGMRKFQLRECIRRKRYQLHFRRRKLDLLLKINLAESRFQRSLYGLVGGIVDFHSK